MTVKIPACYRMLHRASDFEMHRKFWLQNLAGRDHLQDTGMSGRVILEWILEKQGGKVWTGFIWLGIGTSGGLL
jgi:hypothetical protein